MRVVHIARIVLVAALAGTAAMLGVATPAYAATAPVLSSEFYCDVTTGQWQVIWRAMPQDADRYQITARTFEPTDSELNGLFVGLSVGPLNRGPESGWQSLPPGTTSASLSLTMVNISRVAPAVTLSSDASTTEACTRQVAEPSVTFSSGCDLTMTAHLVNAATATADAVLTVQNDVGWSATYTLAPGQDVPVVTPAPTSSVTVFVEGPRGAEFFASDIWTQPDCPNGNGHAYGYGYGNGNGHGYGPGGR